MPTTPESLPAFLVDLAHYSPAGAAPGELRERLENVGHRAASLLDAGQQFEVASVRTLEELHAGDIVRLTSAVEVNEITGNRYLPGVIDQPRLRSAIEKGQVERIAPVPVEPDWKLGDFAESDTGQLYYLRRDGQGCLMWLWIDAPVEAIRWYTMAEMRGKLTRGKLVRE